MEIRLLKELKEEVMVVAKVVVAKVVVQGSVTFDSVIRKYHTRIRSDVV
jgi:hypothetical protein